MRELGLFRTNNMEGWEEAGTVSTGDYLQSGVREKVEKEQVETREVLTPLS